MNIDEKLVAQTVQSILNQREKNSQGDGSGKCQGNCSEKHGQHKQHGKDCGSGCHKEERLPVIHITANITLDFAERLMKRVENKAKEMGMRVVTAVADAHANPVAIRCMDGAYIGSFDVALNKTYTAIAFQMSTQELGKLSKTDGPLYGIQHTNQGRIVIFGGGVPLFMGEQMIGAFGVSGGSAEQDTFLADYAKEQFLEMTRQTLDEM